MLKSQSKILSEIDSTMRNSQWEKAGALLLKLKAAKFSPQDVITYASLCCRANHPGLGISKLRSIVRPAGRKLSTATPLHFIEYARCLVRLGACREAEVILNQINPKNHPQVFQIWGALHLKQWNYNLAIPVYRAHIASLPPGEYQSTVSKLNLCIALISEEHFNDAAAILNEVITTQENWNFRILKGNCYRLFGLLELNRGNYDVALQCLLKAYSTLGDAEGLDPFLTRKLIAITRYFISGASLEAKVGLDTVLQEAISKKLWESVRDIEWHVALFHKDEKQMVKVYFGTPHERFKERFTKKYPNITIPQSYNWIIGPPSYGKQIPVIELEEIPAKPGQALFRLLSVFLSDFYRTFNKVDLYQGTFPGESYRYRDSEQRVFNLLSRFGKSLQKEKSPLYFQSEENGFRLSAHAPIAIAVRTGAFQLETQADHRIEKLKECFQSNLFSNLEVTHALAIGRTSAKVLLAEAERSGLLKRTGIGKKTRYQLISATALKEKKAA